MLPSNVKIVFLGDSLTDGFGIDREKSYPNLVEKTLRLHGHSVTVVNAGMSGDTSAGGLRRLRWYLRTPFQILVLALGANDGLRGLPTAKMKQNLKQMILSAQKSNVKVLLAGMQMPPNYGQKYTQEFKQVYEDLASQLKIPLIPFLLKDVAGNTRLNQPDGLHPNEAGHEVIATTVLSYLEPLL